MKENALKAFLSVACAALAAYFRALAAPLIVLVAVMIADYATGMTRAFITKSFSSRTGLVGIIKKVLYLVLVAVGTVVDFLLSGAFAQIGMETAVTGIIGMIVTVWLIINELISILENLSQAGVPIPAFLVKLVQRLKVATEEKGDDTAANSGKKDE